MNHEPIKSSDITRMLFLSPPFLINLMSCQQVLISSAVLNDEPSVMILAVADSKESSLIFLKILTLENMPTDVSAYVMTDVLEVGYVTQPTLHGWEDQSGLFFCPTPFLIYSEMYINTISCWDMYINTQDLSHVKTLTSFESLNLH